MTGIRDPPPELSPENSFNSGGKKMYIEHPYFYNGKYYAKVDGKMIEITKEVAYAMNNFYRISKPKRIEAKATDGEVIYKLLREIPLSGMIEFEKNFSIESFPDVSCDVEEMVLRRLEQKLIHQVIEELTESEKMLIFSFYFDNKTQEEIAAILGVSQQVVAYRLKKVLMKMKRICKQKKMYEI